MGSVKVVGSGGPGAPKRRSLAVETRSKPAELRALDSFGASTALVQNNKIQAAHTQTPSGVRRTHNPPLVGVAGGVPAQNVEQALAKLKERSPAQIEIFLSYTAQETKNYFLKGANPLAHFGIKIGDKSYGVNGLVLGHPERQVPLYVTGDLKKSLYGARPAPKPKPQKKYPWWRKVLKSIPIVSYFIRTGDGDFDGVNASGAYEKHTLSLRINGVAPDILERMKKFVEEANVDYLKGDRTLQYRLMRRNCVDFGVDLLDAGGYNPCPRRWMSKYFFPSMPATTFEQCVDYFSRRKDLETEVVLYERVKDSSSKYKHSQYPLSIYRPGHFFFNAAKNLVGAQTGGWPEKLITKKIASYPNDLKVYYEELNPMTYRLDRLQDPKDIQRLSGEIQALEREILLTKSSKRNSRDPEKAAAQSGLNLLVSQHIHLGLERTLHHVRSTYDDFKVHFDTVEQKELKQIYKDLLKAHKRYQKTGLDSSPGHKNFGVLSLAMTRYYEFVEQHLRRRAVKETIVDTIPPFYESLRSTSAQGVEALKTLVRRELLHKVKRASNSEKKRSSSRARVDTFESTLSQPGNAVALRSAIRKGLR